MHPDHYAVLGNPISHSKSPLIHSLFAQQTGQQLTYDRILVAPDDFIRVVTDFKLSKGKGLNITAPFKGDAFTLSDHLSERANQARAVNTLLFREDGSSYGDNTDGAGLVTDLLQNLKWLIKGQRLLILGAGGATRGILAPLLAETPASLVIANRTIEKADDLVKAFAGMGPIIKSCAYTELTGQHFDLIINATTAHTQQEVPPLPSTCLDAGSIAQQETTTLSATTYARCYDLAYSDILTPFLTWAKKQGVTQTADGLGMLVEQAGEAFYVWRGIRPLTRPVLQHLRP